MLAGPSVEDVSGWINDRLFVRAMIDSGSRPHNFMSKGTADKLRDMGLTRVAKPITGVLLNGTHFHSEGYFKFSYWISNELSLNIIAYELQSLPVELLLGKSTIDRYKLKVFEDNKPFLALINHAEEISEEEFPEAFPLPKEPSTASGTTASGGGAATPSSRADLCSKVDGYDYFEGFESLLDTSDRSGAVGLDPMTIEVKSISTESGTSLPLQMPAAMRLPTRKYAILEQEAIDKQLLQLEQEGIISKCNPQEVEAWSQIHLVRKKSDDIRLCIDFRALNSICKMMQWPLPKIADLLESLRGSKFFGKLDLKSAYHQIKLDDSSALLTAFKTANGIYKWNRIPFGLQSAPAYFQWLMTTKVLAGLTEGIEAACRCYLDDIIIVGRTLEEFRRNAKKVFERLQQHNIKLSQSKCLLEVQEIEYLGTVIKDGAKSIAPSTREALMKLQKPRTVTQLRSFLGLANYIRQYLPSYATQAAHLQILCNGRSKGAKLLWNPAADAAFDAIKLNVQQAEHLVFVQDTGQFILYTDASDYACGGLLTQIQDGEERPIEYFSKSFSTLQRRWSVSDREMFGILYCVQKSHYFIAGRNCIVRTDHKALPYQQRQSASAKIERWKLLLQEYDLTLEYIKGDDNVNADCMSRVTTSDEDITVALGAISTSNVSVEDKMKHLQRFHGMELAHWGVNGTMDALYAAQVSWPHMRDDVAKFCKTCHICQVTKGTKADSSGQPFSTGSDAPGEVWAVDVKYMPDLQYPDNNSSSYNYLLLAVDMFSREVKARAIRKLSMDSGEVENAIAEWIASEPRWKVFWSDPGKEFQNFKIDSLLVRKHIDKTKTLAAWKQCNGLVEAAIKIISDQINCQLLEKANEGSLWHEQLAHVVWAYNNRTHLQIGVPPIYLSNSAVKGVDAKLRAEALKRATSQVKRLKAKVAKVSIVYEPGDLILVKIKDRLKLGADQRRWDGPFQVTACSTTLVSFIMKGAPIHVPLSQVKKYYAPDNALFAVFPTDGVTIVRVKEEADDVWVTVAEGALPLYTYSLKTNPVLLPLLQQYKRTTHA